MHKVITINRQSGSGGAYIGAKAAEELGIICYDKQLIQMALGHSKMEYSEHADLFSGADEKRPNLAFYRRYSEGNLVDVNPSEAMFELEQKFILDTAQNEDLIVVGRCANYVFRDVDTVNELAVCIVADKEFRVKRVMDESGMSEGKATRFVEKTDKQRSDYYYYITKQHWNDAESYEMVLNSSRLGIDECVKILVACFKNYL